MTCKRCGDITPRYSLSQRYCPQCADDVRMKYAAKMAAPLFDVSPFVALARAGKLPGKLLG